MPEPPLTSPHPPPPPIPSINDPLPLLHSKLLSLLSIPHTSSLAALTHSRFTPTGIARSQMTPTELSFHDATQRGVQPPPLTFSLYTATPPSKPHLMKKYQERAAALNILYATDDITPDQAFGWTLDEQNQILIPWANAIQRVERAKRHYAPILGGGEGAELEELQTLRYLRLVLQVAERRAMEETERLVGGITRSARVLKRRARGCFASLEGRGVGREVVEEMRKMEGETIKDVEGVEEALRWCGRVKPRMSWEMKVIERVEREREKVERLVGGRKRKFEDGEAFGEGF